MASSLRAWQSQSWDEIQIVARERKIGEERKEDGEEDRRGRDGKRRDEREREKRQQNEEQ